MGITGADLLFQQALAEIARTYSPRIPRETKANLRAIMGDRDPREPGREEKLEMQARLERHFVALFNYQKEQIVRLLEPYDTQKAKKKPPSLESLDWLWRHEEYLKGILDVMVVATQGGIGLFARRSPFGIDQALVNEFAAAWARQYTYDLVRGINETTRDVLRQELNRFVGVTGYTIGDVADNLPFKPQRAHLIAVTEITRAYAQGNQIIGEATQEQFPDVKVIKVWFTNYDEAVCPICMKFNGKAIAINGEWGGAFKNPPAHPYCRCWTECTTQIIRDKPPRKPPLHPRQPKPVLPPPPTSNYTEYQLSADSPYQEKESTARYYADMVGYPQGKLKVVNGPGEPFFLNGNWYPTFGDYDPRTAEIRFFAGEIDGNAFLKGAMAHEAQHHRWEVLQSKYMDEFAQRIDEITAARNTPDYENWEGGFPKDEARRLRDYPIASLFMRLQDYYNRGMGRITDYAKLYYDAGKDAVLCWNETLAEAARLELQGKVETAEQQLWVKEARLIREITEPFKHLGGPKWQVNAP